MILVEAASHLKAIAQEATEQPEADNMACEFYDSCDRLFHTEADYYYSDHVSTQSGSDRADADTISPTLLPSSNADTSNLVHSHSVFDENTTPSSRSSMALSPLSTNTVSSPDSVVCSPTSSSNDDAFTDIAELYHEHSADSQITGSVNDVTRLVQCTLCSCTTEVVSGCLNNDDSLARETRE
jgi:hypothetical protein